MSRSPEASSSDWFPRPRDAQDVIVLDGSTLDADELLALFHDPSGEELRHKVGVAGRADGSAKSSTRLLVAQGRMLKSCLASGTEDREALVAHLREQSALAARTPLWHPDKLWVGVRCDGRWFPVSVCPELRTLRQEPSLPQRLAGWIRMLVRGIEASRRHGVGLDLNPANFGWDTEGRLHYLDDELYEPLSMRDIAEAAVSRIPEEPEADRTTWRQWGRRLRKALEPWMEGPRDAQDLRLGAEHYPMAPAFRERRWSFVAGLVPRATAQRPSGPRRTCVLADVHGNLPALEAVLEDASRQGADSYVFLGDAVGYGPHPLECVARLAELPRAVLIRGNHDHAIGTGELEEGMNRLARECALWTRQSIDRQAHDWLAALPVEHVEKDWIAVHGAPRDPHRFLAYVYEMTFRENLEHLERHEQRVCFYGHTHVPFGHRRTPDGSREKVGTPPIIELGDEEIWLVNPGSVGQPRNGDPRAAYAMWDRDTDRIAFRAVGYDIERCVRDLRRAELPSDLAHRLEMGR